MAMKTNKAEGSLEDAEQLAIFLAVGFRIRSMPASRLELLEVWESLDDSKRVAYRLRAKRLLRTWET